MQLLYDRRDEVVYSKEALLLNRSGFNVADYGAAGVAVVAETLTLQHRDYKWIHAPANFSAPVYRARSGQPLDSVGIQAAIDAAHAAGGGTVIVPPGNYLIAPIRLLSRVHLYLEPGAFLWGSADLDDYEGDLVEILKFAVEHSFERDQMRRLRRLISAIDATDISITGFGQISAQSPAFVIPWMNSRPHTMITDRPSDTLLFYRCRNVRIEGIRIVDTPNWTLVFDSCSHVNVRGIRIHAFDVINSDGIDLVDTTDVSISDCDIWCCDDGICLKSTKPDATTGRIVVNNCRIRTLCNGLKLGTDSAGTFEDITFSNIVIYNPVDDQPGSERGSINLCAIDGGVVRNVNISNIVMHNAHCPFYLLAGCRTVQQARYREPRAGTMENISITNLTAIGTRYTAFISGDPHGLIRNVHVQNVTIKKSADFYEGMPPPVPPRLKEYPTPFAFGSKQLGDQLPAYGLYIRHAEHVVVRDFRVECAATDVRPCITVESSQDVVTSGVRTNLPERLEPVKRSIPMDGNGNSSAAAAVVDLK